MIEADVAVVGGGPAGIAAACAAGESGARVVLLDESPRLGGNIWRHLRSAEAPPAARRWLGRLERADVRVEAGASVFDLAPGFRLFATVGDSALCVEAPRVVLATGARELFLPFPGWTLPNVFGVGGLQALVKSGFAVAGKRVVVAGSGPLLLPVAATLARKGALLQGVFEQASASRVLRFATSLGRHPGKILEAALLRSAFAGARYRPGRWVGQARGDGRLREVEIAGGGRSETIACDILAAGFGLVPAGELARLAGCRLRDGCVAVDARQETSVPGLYCAGEPTGVAGAEASVAEGLVAGLAAAGAERLPWRARLARARGRAFSRRLSLAFTPRAELLALARPDTIVCRCEDVALADIAESASAREAKLASRAGMGACQGRVCGAALRAMRGLDFDSVRPPAVPVAIATLAEAGKER